MSESKARLRVSVPVTRRRPPTHPRSWPRTTGRRDPHSRVIAQVLALAGPESSVIATSSRPWASATFQGARHKIILKFSGEEQNERADRFAAALPDAEFTISGHIVADACVDGRACQPDARPAETIIRLSILTIEDW